MTEDNYAGRKEVVGVRIDRVSDGWRWIVLYIGGDYEGEENTLGEAIFAATVCCEDISRLKEKTHD